MTTSYPGGIDNFTNPTSTDTLSSSTVPHASEHANANDAIKAIETELGTNPKGSYASVAARLAASTGSITTWRKAASGGETSLTGTDDFSTTLAYTVGQEQVFINGVLLERGVDYTATSGSSITGLTALVASDIATVISVGTFNVANAIPLSQFTAKGDILVGTGASTEAALNIGADGTTLVANSSASTGVSWAGPLFVAGKNKIINGDFGIWQRGTSFSNPSLFAYTADRWRMVSNNSGGTVTISQQAFTPGSAPVAGYEGAYFFRNAASSPTGATYNVIQHLVEDVRTLAGQTATLSFWAKADASRSFTLGAYQNFGSGGSSEVTITSPGSPSVTTSWQRFSYSFAVPSISGKTIGTGSSFRIEFALPVNTTQTFDIWGVQLEAGSVATPFTTATGTLQGELLAAMRYYEVMTFGSYRGITCQARTSTDANGWVNFVVPKRATPSVTTSGTFGAWNASSATQSATVSFSVATANGTGIDVSTSGLSAGNASLVVPSGGGTGSFIISAEL